MRLGDSGRSSYGDYREVGRGNRSSAGSYLARLYERHVIREDLDEGVRRCKARQIERDKYLKVEHNGMLDHMPGVSAPSVTTFVEVAFAHEGPSVATLQADELAESWKRGDLKITLVASNHIAQQPRDRHERVVGKLWEQLRRYCEQTPPEKRLLMIEANYPGQWVRYPLMDELYRHERETVKYLASKGITSASKWQDTMPLGECRTLKWIALQERLPFMSPDPTPEMLQVRHQERGVPPETLALERWIKLMTNLIPEACVRAGEGARLQDAELRLDEVFTGLCDICKLTTWRKDEARAARQALWGRSKAEQRAIMLRFVAECAQELNGPMHENSVGFDGRGFTALEIVDDKLYPGRGLDLRQPEIFNWFFRFDERSAGGRQTAIQDMQYHNCKFRDTVILERVCEMVGLRYSPLVCFGPIHPARIGETIARATGQALVWKVYTHDSVISHTQYRPA